MYMEKVVVFLLQVNRDARKSVFGLSDQVRHKPDCTTIEDGYRLEIGNLCTIYVVKTKELMLRS